MENDHTISHISMLMLQEAADIVNETIQSRKDG